MARCLVSFGANIGDAWGTIQSAAQRVQEQLCCERGDERSDVRSFHLSRSFRTPPVGGPTGQPPFINAVAAIHTLASPWDVWHCIRNVEKEFGRERNLRWEARRIDLDILLHDDVRIWTPHLKIPHPRMCMRRFILLPAVDVARDWIDPVSGWSIGQLAENVRCGPSNFMLVGEENSKLQSLLAEVARRTGAQWRSNALSDSSVSGRWVSALTLASERLDASQVKELRHCKLLIVLAPKVPAADVAWEDFHHGLACRLGLLEDAGKRQFGFGPRYLLASDDHHWVIQELTAALEAMDCPIEAL
jgi:2-amino-4-hydroxy-6-hydroxymethyldihydropteridine diphosphokinase